MTWHRSPLLVVYPLQPRQSLHRQECLRHGNQFDVIVQAVFYKRGNTMPLCAWYLPFLSL